MAQNIHKHAQETGILDGSISCAPVADAIGSSSLLSPPSESSPNRSSSLGSGSMDAESPTEYFDAMMNNELVSHSVDEQHKLNKFLFTVDQRLVAGKTNTEDLIAQLNQEIAIKESLSLKNGKNPVKSESACPDGDNESLLQELDNKTKQLMDLQKRQDELETKSKSDIRVLDKEVRFLRSIQEKLKDDLNQYLEEKSELERILQKEKQRRREIVLARKKLISACKDLLHRLQESSVNFLEEGEDKFNVNPSSLSDALGLLTTSDTRISLLLAKAQLLAKDGYGVSGVDEINSITDDDEMASDDEIRKLLSDIIADNTTLRKQINSVVRCALKTTVNPLKDGSVEAPPRKSFLSIFWRK
ncbi:uncharacterized protein A4U43_C07F38690 [Asparagus officinalis]|uniref:Uncharacterized protein n=1 Tax=Asparagus officinalis TaxID=4686 RepID=A0A5P1EIJ6_ASPOF|nr:PX domain-containing protein EREX-like [Asparagus officinalis]ONK65594.1 uncharacterized protein A4U43_C07F38690 [Asparagus officinalis]